MRRQGITLKCSRRLVLRGRGNVKGGFVGIVFRF